MERGAFLPTAGVMSIEKAVRTGLVVDKRQRGHGGAGVVSWIRTVALGRRWNTGAGLHDLKRDRRQPGGSPRSSARKESPTVPSRNRPAWPWPPFTASSGGGNGIRLASAPSSKIVRRYAKS